MASITYKNATCIYEGSDKLAVNNLNLDIKDGEFVVLVGPSGSGKSTALRMLAGLEEIDEGDIEIGGKNMKGVPSKDRDIAMVFQNYALYPNKTVAENMGFALKLRGVSEAERRAKVEQAAKLLDLTEFLDRKPAKLSGGQRQRVAMGRAIVREPQVFCMDEPLSNLDAKLRVQTRTEIAALQRRLGTTTVYVTHDQVEAMTMGDRVAVLRFGELQQFASPADLYDKPANAFVAGFIGSPAMNLLTGPLASNGVRVGEDSTLELTREHLGKLHDAGLKEVTVGIRPEHLELSDNGGINVVIDLVEDLGSETYLYTHASPGVQLVARSFSRQPARLADTVALRQKPEGIVHLFHPKPAHDSAESVEAAPSARILPDFRTGCSLDEGVYRLAMERLGRVRLTNADKVLYPATGTTKQDVFDYYVAIAEVMVPHTAGRATRKRWPNGVDEPAFFEKQLASSAPDWLSRASVRHGSGAITYPIIDSQEALAWIAQRAALEVHVPQWMFGSGGPGPATRLVFDLDPGEGVTMPQLCEVAHEVRELMAGIGLTAHPLTSGSKGLHLYAQFETPVSSQGAVVLAKRVAQQLEQTMPKQVTATMTKSQRAGKVFLDWSQNSGSKTTIAPYSLRGRERPTVAAPRTWKEIEDPDLQHLTYDEVLQRVARDGDLLADLDRDAPVADKLTTYRSMRDAGKTPEPVPNAKPAVGTDNTFVIQEHHARRLHYDFRLERNGVLVSWAVPKNLPESPSVNHLAVHTEDHPLEYATFEGDIPQGEYGGGNVIVWDSGTYETEKFRDPGVESEGKDGEVIVTLHGSKIIGRYALIQTGGKNWIAHRTKDQPTPAPSDLAPMLATHGSVARLSAGTWAFEGKWDGYRLLFDSDHGSMLLRTRSGRDVTSEYPSLAAIAAEFADHHVLLDGEVVALTDAGVPSFSEMQNRVRATRIEFWAFDLLYLDGRSLMKARYRDRRKLLETLADGTNLIVPEQIPGEGAQALEYSHKHKWEGVVAKKWESTYQPGRRSTSWVKDKNWNTQEIVIGGWRKGEGGRSSGIGALLMGIPADDGLDFVGRVGTGFSEKELDKLKKLLTPLETDESPFNVRLSGVDARGVTYVEPVHVGEVRFGEWTSDGRLRHPSWRGLRPDKSPDDVVRE